MIEESIAIAVLCVVCAWLVLEILKLKKRLMDDVNSLAELHMEHSRRIIACEADLKWFCEAWKKEHEQKAKRMRRR